MSAQKSNNKILILGVLMLGAYVYMRPKTMQPYSNTAQQNRPVTMPQTVGAGLAQSAVGALAGYIANMGKNSYDEIAVRYADAVVKNPYNLADHMKPMEAIQDIVSPNNWSDNINTFLA